MTPISQYNPYIIPGMDREYLSIPQRIIKIVCEASGISAIALKSKSRKREIVLARHMAIYWLKQKTSLSYNGIARQLRRFDDTQMDHSSVIYAIYTITDLLDIKDKDAINLYNRINSVL